MGLSGVDGGKMVKLWKKLELFWENEGKLFKCDVCDFGVVTDNWVGEHMRNKHEGQGDDFWGIWICWDKAYECMIYSQVGDDG